jgi:hypothetical protein
VQEGDVTRGLLHLQESVRAWQKAK